MRWIGYTFALTATAGLCLHAGAQQVTVRGEVVDRSSGAAIAGASVEITSRSTAALTDAQGRFTLPGMPTGPVTLRVRQLGYRDAVVDQLVTEEMGSVRIELVPNPFILEGLEVMVNRFDARARSIPYSVRAYSSEQLMTAAAFDVYEFLADRLQMVTCPPQGRGSAAFSVSGVSIVDRSNKCIFYRGGFIIPSIFLDDAPWVGDIESFRGWSKTDIHRIDVVRRGGQVWIFTRAFAERVAKGEAQLRPYLIF